MSLKDFSHEQIQNMSMIELASLILLDEKKAIHFKDIFNKLADLRGYSEEEKQATIAQFYTDLNVDGRFITIGENMWGLKRWYPVEQMDEEVTNAPKKKKKAKKKEEANESEEEENLDITDDEMEIFDEDFDIDEDLDELDEDFDEDFDDDEEFEDSEEEEK
ncbi:DNA-directed RNA polymerase subunit delta [Virgibacillus salexigens]|uniref:DNA-directed RNA polymerase subunit delta n=1 Tax=Virgibacillus salexigens TaxID=61016 RepID=UPI0030818728